MPYQEYRRNPEGEKNRLAIVTGVSGCGKDFLTNNLVATNPNMNKGLQVMQFGTLMHKVINQQPGYQLRSRDELSRVLSPDATKSLIQQVVQEVIRSQPALVNVHIAYKDRNGIHAHPDINKAMNPNTYVFVWSDPEQIKEWRTDPDRDREIEAVDDIAMHQEIACAVTRAIAESLGSGFVSVYNRKDNISQNVSVIQEVIERI